MSILKSTHSRKKSYWTLQLNKLSETIYNTVKEFPDNITKAVVYYKVPTIIPTGTGYYTKLYYQNKIVFFKDIDSIEIIKRRLIHAFEKSIYPTDNFVKEDFDLEQVEIVVEK